jgi:hypothetical protein
VRGTGRSILVLLVALAATLVAVPAQAVGKRQQRVAVLHPSFRLVSGGSGSWYVFPSGRYVLLVSGTSTTARVLVDDRTGVRVNPTKPGCAGFDIIGAPWVMGSCSPPNPQPGELATFTLYQISTGTWQSLALNSSIQQCDLMPNYSCGALPLAIGAHWIEFDETCSHSGCENRYVFQNVKTGEARTLPDWRPGGTIIPDLDSPTLARKVCGPLRVPVDHPSGSPFVDIPGPLKFYGSYAIASESSGNYLERCGSHLHTKIGGFGANLHMAVSQTGAKQFSGVFLPSLRRLAFKLPTGISGPLHGGALDSRRLYVIDAHFRVWAALMPSS